MSPRQSALPLAPVFELSSHRRRSSALAQVGGRKASQTTAELLSMRKALQCHAAVEIDELSWLYSDAPQAFREHSKREVRRLLNEEFGSLRIVRNRQRFGIRLHDFETLLAGLLRVQFHAREIELPESARSLASDLAQPRTGSLESGNRGVNLIWGVGRSVGEAEVEQRKRSRARRFQR